MALSLPRLQREFPIVGEDRCPTLYMQQWWDAILAEIEKPAADLSEIFSRLDTAEDDIVDIEANKQDHDETLDGIAALDTTHGLVEQIGDTSFAKRGIGRASSNYIPTFGDVDTYYVPSFRLWRQFYLTNS